MKYRNLLVVLCLMFFTGISTAKEVSYDLTILEKDIQPTGKKVKALMGQWDYTSSLTPLQRLGYSKHNRQQRTQKTAKLYPLAWYSFIQ